MNVDASVNDINFNCDRILRVCKELYTIHYCSLAVLNVSFQIEWHLEKCNFWNISWCVVIVNI
jgi:hypothetical protein